MMCRKVGVGVWGCGYVLTLDGVAGDGGAEALQKHAGTFLFSVGVGMWVCGCVCVCRCSCEREKGMDGWRRPVAFVFLDTCIHTHAFDFLHTHLHTHTQTLFYQRHLIYPGPDTHTHTHTHTLFYQRRPICRGPDISPGLSVAASSPRPGGRPTYVYIYIYMCVCVCVCVCVYVCEWINLR
jgi:hypothetical protein